MSFDSRKKGLYKSTIFFAISLLIVSGAPAQAIDDERLWLPKKHKSYYPKLIKAARSAEKLDRCVSVLEGTIHVERSKPDHPIFRVLCRQPNGLSYTELVDGQTFVPMTSRNYTPMERMQMQESEFSAFCRQHVADKLGLMEGLIWLTEGNPRAETLDENEAIFFYDFNAKSEFGEPLFYRATCTIRSFDDYQIKIASRRN